MPIPTTPEAHNWSAVADGLPQPGVTVLAYYTNRCGNGRRIRAAWIPAKFEEANPEQENVEYDEEKDCYFTPEGWYEQIDNWDDYTAVAVHEGDVTHWMPMPPDPSAALRESVSVTLTETDRSDLRVAANIIDRDGPSPIGVELSATLRRIASAGVPASGDAQPFRLVQQLVDALCVSRPDVSIETWGQVQDAINAGRLYLTAGVDVPGEGKTG